MNAGPRSIIHLQCFEVVSKKKTRSSYIGTTGNGIPLSSSYSAMTPKEKKNRRATFKIHTKIHCLSLIAQDDALFKNRKNPDFLLRPLKAMIKRVANI